MKGNFSFAVVNAGQRNVETKAQLVACSTKGGFRLSGPAAKALGVKPSDYVMFLHDEEQDVWAIANGIALKKSNGEAQECALRDAKKLIADNYDEAYAQAMQSGNEKLVAKISDETLTKEDIIDILAATQTTQKYQGSKTANPSGAVGVGAPVNFTDSNVWGQLKKGLDEPESINRVFELDETEVMDVDVFDGFSTITVKALVLGESTDEMPVVRTKKSE